MSSEEKEVQIHCIKAEKSLMNLTQGLQATINYPDSIKIIALQLGTEQVRMKTVILEMLGAVCFVPPNGHQLVLEAMQYYKEKKTEKFRFETIMSTLASLQDNYAPADMEYMVNLEKFFLAGFLVQRLLA